MTEIYLSSYKIERYGKTERNAAVGMMIAQVTNMKTDIMTILNMIAQQSGSGNILKRKGNREQSSQATDEIVSFKRKSGDRSPATHDRDEFNAMLRKKLDERKPVETVDTVVKTDNKINKEEPEIEINIVSYTEGGVPGHKHEKKDADQLAVNPNISNTNDAAVQSQTSEPQIPASESVVDMEGDNTSEIVPLKSQKEGVSDTTTGETQTTKAEADILPGPPQDATGANEAQREETQASFASSNPLPNDDRREGTTGKGQPDGKASAKASENTDRPTPSMDKFGSTAVQENTEKPESSNFLNRDKSFENYDLKDLPISRQSAETDRDKGQDSVSNDRQELLRTTRDEVAVSQSVNPSSVNPAHAAVHQRATASEHINAISSDKSQKEPQQKGMKDDFKLDAPADTLPPRTSEIGEKPPVQGEFSKIIEHTNSKFSPGRQVQESVIQSYRPGTQQIVIRLDPPDLGRVTIRFIEQKDGITGILDVDKSQTRQEIQEALPGIVHNLQNADIQIKKLDVVLSNQQQNQSAGDQAADQNGGFDQQQSPQQNTVGNSVSYNSWQSDVSPNSDTPQVELTDKSINMLI